MDSRIMSHITFEPSARTFGQLLRYCMVGACGFAVEATVIAMLQYGWQWGAMPCRAVPCPFRARCS
jgi:hypothetical protein